MSTRNKTPLKKYDDTLTSGDILRALADGKAIRVCSSPEWEEYVRLDPQQKDLEVFRDGAWEPAYRRSDWSLSYFLNWEDADIESVEILDSDPSGEDRLDTENSPTQERLAYAGEERIARVMLIQQVSVAVIKLLEKHLPDEEKDLIKSLKINLKFGFPQEGY